MPPLPKTAWQKIVIPLPVIRDEVVGTPNFNSKDRAESKSRDQLHSYPLQTQAFLFLTPNFQWDLSIFDCNGFAWMSSAFKYGGYVSF